MLRALVLAFSLSLAGAAAAQEVVDVSRVEADGSRTLAFEATIDATPATLWPLLSTGEGLQRWAAPLAAIDLRVGGIWEASYAPGGRIGDAGNIHNRVLAFEPERMLAIAIDRTPPGFPHPELASQLWTVITLDPVSETQTRVRIAMLGYGQGEGFDALHGFFAHGNALSLGNLERAAETPR